MDGLEVAISVAAFDIGKLVTQVIDYLFLLGDLDPELLLLACHKLGIILQLGGIEGLTLRIPSFLVPHEFLKKVL